MPQVIDRPAPMTEDADPWVITRDSPALNALQAEYDEAYSAACSQAVALMPVLLDALSRDDQLQLDDVLDDAMLESMADVMPAPLVAEALILALAGALLAATLR
jgi:hypothetical protein